MGTDGVREGDGGEVRATPSEQDGRTVAPPAEESRHDRDGMGAEDAEETLGVDSGGLALEWIAVRAKPDLPWVEQPR